jgi:hypothetical protein
MSGAPCSPPMRAAVLLCLAVLILGACSRSEGEPPTAAEAPLLDHLTRDKGVRTVSRWRDERGHLHILTRQGRREVAYVIMPGPTGSPELRRVADGLLLDTVDP